MVGKIRILVTICSGITSAAYIWSQKESKNGISFNHKISSKMKLIAEEDYKVKFIYSEKATKFCEIFPLLLTVCTAVKSKGKSLQKICGLLRIYELYCTLLVYRASK